MPKVPHLTALRERAGLTQKELARQAHMQEMVVSRAENGGEIFATTIRDLAKVLGVNPEDLIEPAP